MARSDIPPPDQIRDYALLAPHVRQATRETWLDPDWLWNFCKSLQDAGLPTERVLAALQRHHQAMRLSSGKRLVRALHLRLIRGYWDY